MKNFQYKGKVFFWSGIVMLTLAGAVWAFNGGIVKIKSVFANDQSGTCSNPGCYSEEWVADEVFGLYRFAYTDGWMTTRDTGRMDDNFWNLTTGTRVCGLNEWNASGRVTPTSVSSYTSGMGSSCTYRSNSSYSPNGTQYNTGVGFLDTQVDSKAFVTGWTVNGHVH